MALDIDRLARTIATESPDAIIYADRDGKIGFWNRGAERMFGYGTAEALGQSLNIIIPERLRARHWAGFAATMRTGRSRYDAGELLAVPGQRKDGSRLSLEFTVVPIRDAAGALAGIAAVLRDVTARFEELKALRAARDQASEVRGQGRSDT